MLALGGAVVTDLRQGVTEAQHDAIDLVETLASAFDHPLGFVRMITRAAERARDLDRCFDNPSIRRAAVEAAAMLLAIADHLDAENRP